MPATRLFVSHSTQDNAWCRELVTALKAAGYDVWYDEQGLTAGAVWIETLQRELQARDVFVIVLTPEAWASPWVQEEVRLALSTQRTILPVMLKATPVAGFLMTRQWVNVADVDTATGVQRVLVALGSPVVFPAAPAPKHITDAPHIVPPALLQKGFVGRIVDGVEVMTPPMCLVPAGPCLLGTDPRREPEEAEREELQRQVDVAAYYIGKYPVTVAEYANALKAQNIRPPGDWSTQATRPDHPVTRISWKAALAYVAWLAQVTGEPWRLPTEEEWEKAARGNDGRIYPWGDAWDSTRANTEEGGPGDTTPVGSYPAGASPYGVLDLAGNVNEWCGIPPDSPLLLPGAWTGGEPRKSVGYLAGGGWDEDSSHARAAYRSQLLMGQQTDDTGFRLVWQPPAP
jgi:toxoflavin biosynthesis protein ToxD